MATLLVHAQPPLALLLGLHPLHPGLRPAGVAVVLLVHRHAELRHLRRVVQPRDLARLLRTALQPLREQHPEAHPARAQNPHVAYLCGFSLFRLPAPVPALNTPALSLSFYAITHSSHTAPCVGAAGRTSSAAPLASAAASQPGSVCCLLLFTGASEGSTYSNNT